MRLAPKQCHLAVAFEGQAFQEKLRVLIGVQMDEPATRVLEGAAWHPGAAWHRALVAATSKSRSKKSETYQECPLRYKEPSGSVMGVPLWIK